MRNLRSNTEALTKTPCIQSVNTMGHNAHFLNGTAVGQIALVPYTADSYFNHKTSD